MLFLPMLWCPFLQYRLIALIDCGSAATHQDNPLLRHWWLHAALFQLRLVLSEGWLFDYFSYLRILWCWHVGDSGVKRVVVCGGYSFLLRVCEGVRLWTKRWVVSLVLTFLVICLSLSSGNCLLDRWGQATHQQLWCLIWEIKSRGILSL